MGNGLIFQFLYINVLNYVFTVTVQRLKKIKNVGKMFLKKFKNAFL